MPMRHRTISEMLLMDEPFGALDVQRREKRKWACAICIKAMLKPSSFVIHDVEEAVFLADRVIIFSRRPARVLRDVSVTARFGSDRPLELRDSPEFFALQTELLHAVRASAEGEE